MTASTDAPIPQNSFSRLYEPSFWRTLNPNLHVEDVDFIGSASTAFDINKTAAKTFSNRMQHDGYLQYFVPPEHWNLSIENMAEGVRSMFAQKLMPIFCLMYDEFWMLFAKQSKMIAQFLGDDYLILPDFWIWHVDPTKGESGWSPHRDKGSIALYPDGRPKSLTVWIPLTDATPLNSCMHIVPANRDVNYNSPNEKEWRFNLPDIRALPAVPGHVLCWNQAVLHWGGNTSPFADAPRISVAFEFQRADVEPFNQPLLNAMQVPSFNLRLLLICKQILQFTHMYPLSADLEHFAREVLSTLRP